MKFEARVTAADGTPLAKATASLVVPSGRGLQEVARGSVAAGVLSLDGQPGPVWGIVIDGKPVIAFPAAADEERADLGEVTLVTDGVAWPAFHAPDGRVFGVPSALRGAGGKEESALPPPQPEPSPAPQPAPQPLPENGGATTTSRTGTTFGRLVGSASQQLSSAALPQSSVLFTGATVKLKGIPTVTEEALGLTFPDAQLAATGSGLSELSFTLRPVGDVLPPQPAPQPTGPTVPNLVGYTQELAARKLGAMGLLSEVSSEIVTDPSRAGRVNRHIPAAGAAAPSGSVVRLFVGKHGGA